MEIELIQQKSDPSTQIMLYVKDTSTQPRRVTYTLICEKSVQTTQKAIYPGVYSRIVQIIPGYVLVGVYSGLLHRINNFFQLPSVDIHVLATVFRQKSSC